MGVQRKWTRGHRAFGELQGNSRQGCQIRETPILIPRRGQAELAEARNRGVANPPQPRQIALRFFELRELIEVQVLFRRQSGHTAVFLAAYVAPSVVCGCVAAPAAPFREPLWFAASA